MLMMIENIYMTIHMTKLIYEYDDVMAKFTHEYDENAPRRLQHIAH